MKYWRTPLTTGGYDYARTWSVGRADLRSVNGSEWARDDYLWAEIYNTGDWEPATPEEVEALEKAV